MAQNLYALGAIYVTDTTAVTGSFSAVQVGGTIAGSSTGGQAKFANIQFGIASSDGATNTSKTFISPFGPTNKSSPKSRNPVPTPDSVH